MVCFGASPSLPRVRLPLGVRLTLVCLVDNRYKVDFSGLDGLDSGDEDEFYDSDHSSDSDI